MRDYLVVCVGCNKTRPVVYDVIKVDKKMEDDIFAFDEKEFETFETPEELKKHIPYNGDLECLVRRFDLELSLDYNKMGHNKYISFISYTVMDEGYSELKCFELTASNKEEIRKVFEDQCNNTCFMHVVCIEKPIHNTIFDIVNAMRF